MKVWVKRLLIPITMIVTLLFAIIGPIDHSPLGEKDFYKKMNAQLDSLSFSKSDHKYQFKSGWKKINITPDKPMSMAGYRVRDNFESVHDSLYARVLVLNTADQQVFLISLDLLLFPPALKQKLEDHFKTEKNRPFLYLSATHTHNGIGCWHDSVVGNTALGNYSEKWVEETKDKIITAIEETISDLQPASISYWESDAHEFAENRLKPGAPYDGMLRGIKLIRSDSTTSHLISFSAHATSISKKSKSLSGDYPAAVIDSLMKATNSFGIFMAGMVGSHRLAGMNETEFDLVAEAGGLISRKIESASFTNQLDSVKLVTAHIPIQFGASQLRITKNWKLRDWIFSWLINPLQGELTYLQINNIILIGTPCDFSGEIYVKHIAEIGEQQNKKVIITSFNGDYVGYITEDEHYEALKKEEVMALNWVGPYYGDYFSELIITLLKK
jgi:hypothetical protein